MMMRISVLLAVMSYVRVCAKSNADIMHGREICGNLKNPVFIPQAV